MRGWERASLQSPPSTPSPRTPPPRTHPPDGAPPLDRIAGLQVPRAESPLLERWIAESAPPPEDAAVLRDFAEKGYAVLDLGLDDFDARVERLRSELAPRYPADDRRIMEAWAFSEDVRALACAPRVLELLELLYGRRPIPFQTLNFDVGTEQPAHSDTLHFHCAPRHFMAGAWVALEDIDGACGALVVWPGSHRLPDLDMHDLGLPSSPEHYSGYEALVAAILADSGIEPVELHMEKGQVVVWAANLYHGGSPVKDPARTRHSQVTHYYFDDCLYYFPMASDPFARQMCMREVIDLGTLRFVPHAYRGRVLDLEDYRYTLAYPRPLPESVQRGELPEARPMSDGMPDDARQRIWELEDIVRFQRGDLAELKEENRELVGMLHRTWTSLPFRLTHGIRKTLRTWRGQREPVP